MPLPENALTTSWGEGFPIDHGGVIERPGLAGPESLTSPESAKKETLGLVWRNQRMFPAMTTDLKTCCGHMLLPLTLALFGASAANLWLVWSWL